LLFCQASCGYLVPHPREPLHKGLDEATVEGF